LRSIALTMSYIVTLLTSYCSINYYTVTRYSSLTIHHHSCLHATLQLLLIDFNPSLHRALRALSSSFRVFSYPGPGLYQHCRLSTYSSRAPSPAIPSRVESGGLVNTSILVDHISNRNIDLDDSFQFTIIHWQYNFPVVQLRSTTT
jgi:hypothetical protein